MKHSKFYLFPLFLILLSFFSSCDDDDNKPKGEFESGIFVINEGNFLDADGTVSHINLSGEVTNDLFGSVNNGMALGDIIQSMSVNGDEGYIVVNNSNKVEVVNINTFASTHTIENLKLPRYFTVFNGKGYVTEWVNFSDPGRVSVIDLSTYQATGSITTDFGAENIIAKNGKLYVSNNFSNTLSVIDPSSASVVKTIEVGNAPGEFVVDSQDFLWVICGGGYDSNFNPLNDGKLMQINTTTNEVIKTIQMGMNISAKSAINKARNTIYFYKGNSIYAVPTSSASISVSNILVTENSAGSFYGIGVDPDSDMIYTTDTKAFAGSGVVFNYSSDGTNKETYTVGRGPNGFLFR